MRDRLAGLWVHAHEEDSGGEMVYRPAGHPLPPARGRTALDLRADGTYTERGPGPDDRPVADDGSWSLDGDRLTLGGTARQPGQALTVCSVEPDRLVVRPQS